MPPDRAAGPDDPREWLRIAREDLALAESSVAGVGFGLLFLPCAATAEKAVKAVLIARSISFHYVHDIGLLLHLARSGHIDVPPEVADADLLTDYSTLGRYPGHRELEQDDYYQATVTAEAVVKWAEQIIIA